MYQRLALALLLTVFMAGDAFAQSSNKGSGNRNSGNRSTANNHQKQQRELQKQQRLLARQIKADHFAGVRLDRSQQALLNRLVSENHKELVSLDTQMGSLIPSNKQRALKRAYRDAIKEGSDETEAMQASMAAINLPESTQEKMMELIDSKNTVMDAIRNGLIAQLTDEQKALMEEASEDASSDST